MWVPNTTRYRAWLGPRLPCQAAIFHPDVAITFEESVLKYKFSRSYPVSELSGTNALHSTATIHIFLWENMESDKQSSSYKWGFYLMEIRELHNMYLMYCIIFSLTSFFCHTFIRYWFWLIASSAQCTHTNARTPAISSIVSLVSTTYLSVLYLNISTLHISLYTITVIFCSPSLVLQYTTNILLISL